MSPITQPDEYEKILGWAMKIGAIFVTFVSGIVTATWLVADRLHGFEKRIAESDAALKHVADAQTACRTVTLAKIDEKLDRIHERIDDILLTGNGAGRQLERSRKNEDGMEDHI